MNNDDWVGVSLILTTFYSFVDSYQIEFEFLFKLKLGISEVRLPCRHCRCVGKIEIIKLNQTAVLVPRLVNLFIKIMVFACKVRADNRKVINMKMFMK